MEGRDPVPWLVERGVVRTDLPCKFCQDKGLELQRDPGALNGYSLCCRQARWVNAPSGPRRAG